MSTVIAEGAITDSTVGYGNLGLTYNGFGPRVGADMSYSLVRGLVVYANGATAMLAGKSNLTSAGTISATSITPSTITNSIYTTNQGHKTIVPELEGKLGLNYSCVLSRGELTIDAGYLWVNYFNVHAIEFVDSNFAIQGPTVGIKWIGNFI